MKAVALVSGGLDSVVNLKCAADQGQVALALTFDYGQSAFENERKAASLSTQRHQVVHKAVQLDWYRDLVPAALAGKSQARACADRLPADREVLLREAWVPNRNAVFLNIGAAFAEALGADTVVVGFNREEAGVFPDNSVDFLDAANRALSLSTLSEVQVKCYTAEMTKEEIVKLGIEIGAALDIVYSCYRSSSDQRMCGVCQSCVRLKAALRANGLVDRFMERFIS